MPIEYTLERQNIFKYSWKIIKITCYLKLVIQLRNEKSIRMKWWWWKELKMPIEYTLERQNIFKYSWKLIKIYKLFKISYTIKKWKEHLSKVKNNWWCWKELKMPIEYTVERQDIFKYSWGTIKITNYLKLVIQLRNEKNVK